MNAHRLAFAAAAVLLLAGCTAVPSHSAPQTISFNPQNPTAVPTESPPPLGASPREIVQDFLNVSAAEAGVQSSASQYLTRAVRGSWQDSSVTIVDAISVSNYSPDHPTITVRGREIGSVDDQGVYKATNDGIGSGGKTGVYVYGITKVRGQYRIDKLPGSAPGLLLSVEQFADVYASHALEFYDLADHYLIPDMRYSPLHDELLADWLISQLAAGPRTELQKAVSPSDLPAPDSGTQIAVKLGKVTKVSVAGAAQLPRSARDRLAAQIGQTLVDVVGNGGFLSIVDSGQPIQIPAVGSNQFVPAQFDAALGPAQPPPELFYVRAGRVADEDGKALVGTGVDGTTPLNSVAVASSDQDPNSLSVAGNVVASGIDRLYVGTQQLGLRRTDVQAHITDAAHLPLTRPAWAPGRPEVWIGAGSTLYRLTVSGVATTRHAVPLPATANGAPIKAVRISPDGSRIALVLGETGRSQLWEGVIVRTAGQVRVGAIAQISPSRVVITDVAWDDPLKLFAIGYLKGSLDASVVCETNVDGSGWALSGVTGLPGGPDAITITASALAWVSVGDTVWRQSGSDWASPSGTGVDQVPGSNPIYLE